MSSQLQDRQFALFAKHQGQNFKQTDRLFCYVLVMQWLAGIAISLFISPKIWNLTQNVQLNVWLAIVLGGIICGLPIFCALSLQGTTVSRHSIAIAQALISALFIHLTGGRAGSHFQIFGSLALLSLYRDPKVLISATLVATVDHIVRGIYWPESMFGTETSDPLNWVEFFGWLVFANIILFLAIRQNKKEFMELCQKESELELSARNIEPNQTQELTLPESTFTEPIQFAEISDEPINHDEITDPVKEDIRTLRVLVLDENEISRHVLQQLLTSWGLRNEAAEDLSHLIEKLRAAEGSEEPYNVAVVSLKDNEIPILIEAIKTQGMLSATKFILLQSVDNREFLNFAREIAFEARLSKPFRASQLMDVLSSIVEDMVEQAQSTFRNHSEPYMELDWVDQNCVRKLQDLSQSMDPAELSILIEEFIGSCKQYLSGMKHACSETRPDYLRMHAQSLKGCSLYLGAIRMSDLCMKIEKFAMLKDMETAKELISKLELEFEQIKTYLYQEKESHLRMPAV